MFELLYMFLKEQKQVPNIVTGPSVTMNSSVHCVISLYPNKRTVLWKAAADLDKVLGHFWRKVPQKSKLEGLLKESLY